MSIGAARKRDGSEQANENWLSLLRGIDGGDPQRLRSCLDELLLTRTTGADSIAAFGSLPVPFALHEIICDSGEHPVDYKFVAVNSAYELQTGLAAERLIGRSSREVFPTVDAQSISTYGHVALTGKPTYLKKYESAAAKWFGVVVYCPAPGEFACLYSDITAEHKAETEQRNSQAQLRALTSQLALTEERERRRLAALLHDGICQELTYCQIKLSMARQMGSTEKAAALLQHVSEVLEKTTQSTRSLTYELCPPCLYASGLEAALQSLAANTQQRCGLQCVFTDLGAEAYLPEHTRALLYQAARELLHNVVKHACATRADLTLHKTVEMIELTVSDNGRGFASDCGPAQAGFGLFSIRERMRYMGGACQVFSSKGSGTRVVLTVPLGG